MKGSRHVVISSIHRHDCRGRDRRHLRMDAKPRRHMIAGGEFMGDPYAQCKESARHRLQPCRT